MSDKKRLIIYFSRADENYAVGYIEKGNTEIIAEYIQDITNADIFKVERKIPYGKDYQTCIQEAKKEIDNDERPELVHMLDSIAHYEVIYVGGPIYWGYLPQPMVTLLEKLDWNSKIIKPFTTHEGSGLGSVPNQLKRICVGARVLDGLAIRGTSVATSKDEVEKWCNIDIL